MATVPGYLSLLQSISLCSFALAFFDISEGHHLIAALLPSGRANWSLHNRVIWVRKWPLLQLEEDSPKTVWSWWIVTSAVGNMALIMLKLKNHFGNLELWSFISPSATGAAITEHMQRTVDEGKDNRGRVYPVSDMNQSSWATFQEMKSLRVDASYPVQRSSITVIRKDCKH